MEANKLKDRVAVVTGGGGTLGSEIARDLVSHGAKVAILGRTQSKLDRVAEGIKAQGDRMLPLTCDVTDEKAVSQVRERIREQFGPISILINAAGGNKPDAVATIKEFDPQELETPPGTKRGFFNLDMADFSEVIQTNTMGTVIPCFVFGRDMAASGAGAIINFASMTSYRALSRVGAYAIAKAGIVNFTQWLAAYLAPANIRVNAVAPGFFLNDRSRKLLLTPDEQGFSERGASIIAQTPLRRFGEASELLGCIHWLIDDTASGFVTGITVPIDGGFLSSPGI